MNEVTKITLNKVVIKMINEAIDLEKQMIEMEREGINTMELSRQKDVLLKDIGFHILLAIENSPF